MSGPNAWLEATVASGNIRRMLLASQAAAVRVLFIQDGWAEPAMCEVLAAAGLMRFVGYREALDRDRRRVVLLVALEYDTTLEQHFSEEAGCPVARSLHEAVAVSLAVATSLTALHGSEAVHGDVRPATVAVNYRDPGAGEGGRDLADVHLVPFAATKDGRAVERRPGAGTPYRAPEAAAGETQLEQAGACVAVHCGPASLLAPFDRRRQPDSCCGHVWLWGAHASPRDGCPAF